MSTSSVAVRRTRVARASLVVLSFLVLAVHSFIPAQPSNSTDATANLLRATLNVFWFDKGQLTIEFARAVATSDISNVATGALVHYTDDASSGTTKTPWVALVSCDSNATNASQNDIFAHAKTSGAQAAVLYSLFSETCVVTTGYSNPSLDVYVSTSATSSKLIENTFQNINAANFSNFDAATLDWEFANVTLAPSVVHPGYAVAVIAAHVPIFSSVMTALPTSAGSYSNGAGTAEAGTQTSLASNSTATNISGHVNNVAAIIGLPVLTLVGDLLIALSLTALV